MRYVVYLTIGLALLAALGRAPASALAQAPVPLITILTISPMEPLSLEDDIVVEARLTTLSGRGLAGQELDLYLEGRRERNVATDQEGMAYFEVRRDLAAATYGLEVVFEGTPELHPSRTSTELLIQPAQLSLQVVPPLPNVPIVIQGETLYTDSNGQAVYPVSEIADYQIEVLDPQINDPTLRAEFERWEEELFVPQRTLEIRGDQTLYIGFSLSYQVTPTFVDPVGDPVAPERISSLTVNNNQGALITLDSFEPHWFTSSIISRHSGKLQAKPVIYNVQSVIVDGAEVVNRGQQTLEVEPGGQWQIELLLFSIQVSARDALFGFPIGSGIQVEYPDGKRRYWPFEEDDMVRLDGLARGLYQLRAVEAPGVATLTPVALSRSQEVELLVVSWLDIGVVLGLAIVVAFGLLFLGRPQLIPWRARPSAAARGAAGASSQRLPTDPASMRPNKISRTDNVG